MRGDGRAEGMEKTHTMRNISLDLIPDPFLILRADGAIHDLNEGFSRLVGFSKEELTGRDFREIGMLKTLEEKIARVALGTTEDFERLLHQGRHYEIFILPFESADKRLLVRILFKDVSNFVRLENELLRRNRELVIINTLSNTFISSDNLDGVLEELMEKVLLVTDFHIGWLLIREGQSFKLKTSRGLSKEFQKNIGEGALEDACRDMFQGREPLHLMEPAALSGLPLFRDEGISYLIGIPLYWDKGLAGIFFLAGRLVRDFDFDFAALLSLVGSHVSHIIGKINLFHETERLAITDALTGLFNSRHFYNCLDVEIARTNRYGGSFSIILLDIDNFKKLNDTYGHQAGDTVLQGLAGIMKSLSRETDIVVRYGGEEFIIVLPNTTEEETVFLAHRLKNVVQETVFPIGTADGVSVTLSGGIASYPQNAGEARSLLSAADNALYASKSAGKNTILCFQGRFDEKGVR